MYENETSQTTKIWIPLDVIVTCSIVLYYFIYLHIQNKKIEKEEKQKIDEYISKLRSLNNNNIQEETIENSET